MATIEELQAQLQSAEAAYHQLMIGKSPRVVVDQNGERVEFTVTNSTKLLQYIQRLKREISGKGMGPLKVFF